MLYEEIQLGVPTLLAAFVAHCRLMYSVVLSSRKTFFVIYLTACVIGTKQCIFMLAVLLSCYIWIYEYIISSLFSSIAFMTDKEKKSFQSFLWLHDHLSHFKHIFSVTVTVPAPLSPFMSVSPFLSVV